MTDAKFEKAFLKAVRKHSGIRKQIEQKVLQITEHPVELGEPLKGDFRGFYSCPVKRNFTPVSTLACPALIANTEYLLIRKSFCLRETRIGLLRSFSYAFLTMMIYTELPDSRVTNCGHLRTDLCSVAWVVFISLTCMD